MYSIIVFTQEEFENRFKELEENYGITRKMFFDSINFPNNFNTEKLNPKYLKVGTYTKILEALFDAEKNPEKYKIFEKNSSSIIEKQKPENAEMSFIDSIIAGIPSIETENNHSDNKNTQKTISEKEEKIKLRQIISKAPKHSEDFKFFTRTFGQENIETNEKKEETSDKIFSKKPEPTPNISHLIPETPKPDIYIPIKTEDIEVLQKFSKQIILMEGKIARGKPSKYSLANIRDEYNFFVKKLEKKYYQNLSEYYILKNIYDDITMEYYFPDSAGTRKIINLLTGKLISQKNWQELNPDFLKNFSIKTPIETPPKPIVTTISPEIISPRTGKKIVIKGKVEPKKEKTEMENMIGEPKNNFIYIKKCANMLENMIKIGPNQEEIKNIINLFHERLKDIEHKDNIYLGNYYIQKDTFNPVIQEFDFPGIKKIIRKMYTCAGHIYVNKI